MEQDKIEIEIDIMTCSNGNIWTTLKHPSLSPNSPSSHGRSLNESLAALDHTICKLPWGHVRFVCTAESTADAVLHVDEVMWSLICYPEHLPESVCGWHTLCLLMPDHDLELKGSRPRIKWPKERSKAQLHSKSIVYSGALAHVPFPWYDLCMLAHWGVKNVFIKRILSPWELRQLISNAHSVAAHVSVPLKVQILGVVGLPIKKGWESAIDQGPYFRLRQVNLGEVGPLVEHLRFLISSPMEQLAEIELDVSKHRCDGNLQVLSDLILCTNLEKLKVKIGLKCRAWEPSDPGRNIITAKRDEITHRNPGPSPVSAATK
ncbi:hypothetical protein GGF50DRAFT_91235 [Schizophyllum commune]